MSMEWFPNHVKDRQEDDINPDGTAVLELNIQTGQTESIIFVGGKSFASRITFESIDLKEVVKYIEKETGLIYGEHFRLTKADEHEYRFQSIVDGIVVSPSGHIDIECDDAGRLLQFSVYPPFPNDVIVKQEKYSLKLEKVEAIAKEQLKLIEFPVDEQKKLHAVYGIEEIYITNDGTSTIPFELIEGTGEYEKIDKILNWKDPIHNSFERMPINFQENITIEQALLCVAHPDTYPITDDIKEKCVSLVEDFLRQVYPEDTGKWILKTLHRDKGYIHATLRFVQPNGHVFQRKLVVMIDSKYLKVLNYIDNQPFIEMFNNYEPTDTIIIEKMSAYERLMHLIELKPVYVYDRKSQNFILCGKLDCQFGIHASTGEIISLNEL